MLSSRIPQQPSLRNVSSQLSSFYVKFCIWEVGVAEKSTVTQSNLSLSFQYKS